jgi:hypothetical protein
LLIRGCTSTLFRPLASREWQAKVFDRKIGDLKRQALHDVLKINDGASNGCRDAFVDVSNKLRDFTKTLQNMGKDLKIFFERSHKNRHIIGIEGGLNRGAVTTKTMEISMGCGLIKELLQGINGGVKKNW